MISVDAPAGDVVSHPGHPAAMRTLLTYLLFLISGCCGLIYEVLWTRQLGLIFGNTINSLSAVLTAFMAGLALGSYISGRLCHRLKRPLMVYGVLEFLIGAYCALLPILFSDHGPIVPFYRALYSENGGAMLAVARFAISFVLLLIPTTFMGATLPVLSHFLVRSRRTLGRTVGMLYGVNSFGAVIGAVATGFYLLPELGKLRTNWVAVGCNLALGLIAFSIGRRSLDGESAPVVQPAPATPPSNASPATAPPGAATVSPAALKAALLTFGVTGFAAMATQIAWTRAISLATGSSTYAFSLIVAVFILGLSLGGFWAARMAARTKDVVAMLGGVLLLTGLTSILVSTLLGYGPYVFFFVLAWGSSMSWPVLLASEALGIAFLILIPTCLMGATTPLTMQVASSAQGGSGRVVGTVYAINTIGAIAGSALGGLVLIPTFYIQSTLEMMALCYAVPGLLLFCLSGSRRRPAALLLVAAAIIPLLWLIVAAPRWNPVAMSGGAYLLRDASKVAAARQLRIMDAMPNFSTGNLLYYNEGTTATVAVAQGKQGITLIVGGKPDASSSGDMTTQILLALLPALASPKDAEDVLIIGLGSGVTAGAALSVDSVKNLDVVEMSPEVVEASKFFAPYSGLTYTESPHAWLNTPRLKTIVNDGRNHLLLTSKKYDIISSEPSNPWIAGIGSLFTREAFELSREHLKPGGIMCQWLQSYSLEHDDFGRIIHTFAEVFPHIQLCWVNDGDYILLGSETKIEIPIDRLKTRIAAPNVRKFLERIHHDNAAEIFASSVGDADTLRAREAGAETHTDDNMLLEFSAPRALHVLRNPVHPSQYLPVPECLANLSASPSSERGELLRQMDLAVLSRQHLMFGIDGLGSQKLHDDVAIRLAPEQHWVFNLRGIALDMHAMQLMNGAAPENAASDPAAAVALIESNSALSTSNYWPLATYNRALLKSASRLLSAKKPNEALAELNKCSDPRVVEEKALLEARADMQLKDYAHAHAALQKAVVESGASPLKCAEANTRVFLAAGDSDAALAFVESVLRAVPPGDDPQGSALLYALRGEILAHDRPEDALASIQMAVRLDSQNTDFLLALGRLHASRENWPAASDAFSARMSRLPGDVTALSDYADALLHIGTGKEASPNHALHQARRASREICTLEPDDPKGWELLCRSFLALEKSDASSAGFYHGEAAQTYAKILKLSNGDVSKLPQDMVRVLGK